MLWNLTTQSASSVDREALINALNDVWPKIERPFLLVEDKVCFRGSYAPGVDTPTAATLMKLGVTPSWFLENGVSFATMTQCRYDFVLPASTGWKMTGAEL